MKSIISINNKFFSISPKELVNIIKNNSKYTIGFEISVDVNNSDEVLYMRDLAYQCKQGNFIFQVHGNSLLTVDKQITFLKDLENISDQLGYKINVVMHSIVGVNYKDSIKLTTDYLNKITDYIDNNKIQISLENLNDINDLDRLNVDDITPIIANNENIYLTYDIGHILADYGSVTALNKVVLPLISNVHIHSINSDYSHGYDHKPIFKTDIHFNAIIKALIYLKINNYSGTIVFEYDLNSCIGNTVEERIISYLKSIDFVSEHII